MVIIVEVYSKPYLRIVLKAELALFPISTYLALLNRSLGVI